MPVRLTTRVTRVIRPLRLSEPFGISRRLTARRLMLCARAGFVVGLVPSGSRAIPTYVFQGTAHYRTVYDAAPRICGPMAAAYNHLLSETVEDLRHGQAPPVTPIGNPVSTMSTDFEISQGNRFAAYGFKLPPLLNGDVTEGVYSVDIFNDGTKLPVAIVVTSIPHTASTYLTIFRQDAPVDEIGSALKIASEGLDLVKRPDAIMSANLGSWFNEDRSDLFPGYILRHWPKLGEILARRKQDHNVLPPAVLDRGTTAQVFVGPEVVVAANEATDFRALSRVHSNVVIYRMHKSGPEDLCYLHLDYHGNTRTVWRQK